MASIAIRKQTGKQATPDKTTAMRHEGQKERIDKQQTSFEPQTFFPTPFVAVSHGDGDVVIWEWACVWAGLPSEWSEVIFVRQQDSTKSEKPEKKKKKKKKKKRKRKRRIH